MASGEETKFDKVPASIVAKRTNNPIRRVVETEIKLPKDRKVIPLSLGDPTVFGNLKPPAFFIDGVRSCLDSYEYNGYIHSAGRPDVREAIAKRYSTESTPLTANDVVVASGCSGALDLAIGVLLNEGDNLLMPCPGFALYQTLAESKGVEVRKYPLDSSRSWEADLDELEKLVDAKTGAILVNNPSNPCGSVYSKEHLAGILAIAEKHKVPIISDEIYGELVFEGAEFTPIASLTTTVPVLTVGGIAKEFLVPGWRVGWVLIHDRNGAFEEIRDGLFSLSQLILGACSLIQGALPLLLDPKSDEHKEELTKYRTELVATLEENAKFTVERLGGIKGLQVIVPQGAMYVMVAVDPTKFDDTINSDMEFVQRLIDEEAVFVLPGKCFAVENFFRVVFSAPKDVLSDAYDRITRFCERHTV